MLTLLALSVEEILGIIGAACTVLTAIIIPCVTKYKKYKKKKEQEQKELAQQKEMTEEMYKEVISLKEMHQSFDQFLLDYNQVTIHNLKYMINDAFFGYSNISDIPDDILTNACECCEIYVNQRHHNHEIKPRCVLLWAEQEKRATEKEGKHE